MYFSSKKYNKNKRLQILVFIVNIIYIFKLKKFKIKLDIINKFNLLSFHNYIFEIIYKFNIKFG